MKKENLRGESMQLMYLLSIAEAAKRGVSMQIVVPGPHTDAVEIYEFQPSMYHVKVMIVDGAWVSVGSTNFDTRSFSTNDKAHRARITLEEWEKRPWSEKLWEDGMGLLSSQL